MMVSCALTMCRGAVVKQGLRVTASAMGRSLCSHPLPTPRFSRRSACRSPFPLIGPMILLSQQFTSQSSVRADAAHDKEVETQTLEKETAEELLEEASMLSSRAEAKLQELQSKSTQTRGDDIQSALADLKHNLSSLQAKLAEYRSEFMEKKTTPPDTAEQAMLDEVPNADRPFLSGFIPSFPSALHLPHLPRMPHLHLPGPISLPQVIRREKRTVATEGAEQAAQDDKEMGEVCTADELHYVEVKGTEWKLALWRYRPAKDAVKRNHPVLLLAGVASNAFTFDLDPQVSMARHLAARGFDTWVAEVRGNGLTKRVTPEGEVESEVQIELQSLETILPSLRNFGESEWAKRLNVNVQDYINYLEKLLPLLERYLERIKPFLTRGSRVVDQTRSSAREFQRLFDWDFDSFLLEDVPAAMEFVKEKTAPKDGKVLAIGHSMGGILLYCLLSTKGKEAGLKAAVTLASALDYSPGSVLKLILPLEIPASRLQVPAIPLGIMMRSIQPVVAWAPTMWPLTWLSKHVSANGSMDPALVAKVYGMNFGTVSVKALLQLATVFQPGGLQSRDGQIKYMEQLKTTDVPILAVAGDQDTICPPNTVQATAKVVPENLLEYHCFGGHDNSHYGHYDLLGHRNAPKEVFPVVFDFLEAHDALEKEPEPEPEPARPHVGQR